MQYKVLNLCLLLYECTDFIDERRPETLSSVNLAAYEQQNHLLQAMLLRGSLDIDF